MTGVVEAVGYVSYVTAAFDTRTFGTKLVFCLSIADFIRALLWYPWNVNEILCITQAVLTQFSEFASFMWIFCIAMCLFQTYYLGASEERLGKLMAWFQVGCWGLPACIAIVPFIGGRYGKLGEDDKWCWIKDMADPERLLLYVPCVLIFILNSLAFVLITIKLRQYQSFLRDTLQKNMALYLLSFLLAQAPAITCRLYLFFSEFKQVSKLSSSPRILFGQYLTYKDDDMLELLILLQAIFQPLQGLFDGLVYGVNDPTFTTNYKRMISRLWRRTNYQNIGNQKSEFYFDYDASSESNYAKRNLTKSISKAAGSSSLN